jgi:hypothetical protein
MHSIVATLVQKIPIDGSAFPQPRMIPSGFPDSHSKLNEAEGLLARRNQGPDAARQEPSSQEIK